MEAEELEREGQRSGRSPNTVSRQEYRPLRRRMRAAEEQIWRLEEIVAAQEGGEGGEGDEDEEGGSCNDKGDDE